MPHYEYDKDYPFAAFITNLGKYNEGDLVGEWVKFPTTPEEMQKVFERIGIGQKDDFGQPYSRSSRWAFRYSDCRAVRLAVSSSISARSRLVAGRGTASRRFSSLAAASNRIISPSCPRRNFSLSLDWRYSSYRGRSWR